MKENSVPLNKIRKVITVKVVTVLAFASLVVVLSLLSLLSGIYTPTNVSAARDPNFHATNVAKYATRHADPAWKARHCSSTPQPAACRP